MPKPDDDEPIVKPKQRAFSHSECEQAMQKLEDALATAPASGVIIDTILGNIGSLSTHISDYLQARKDEDQEPYLDKDYPKMNHWSQLPKRPTAADDSVHQAEHKVSATMHHILNNIEELPQNKPKDDIVSAFRGLATELAHMGIYLDQGKTYANKSTMPVMKGGDLKPAKPRGHEALFTRLNDLGSGSRER